MGSSAVAAWIAHVTFWVLLAYGWFWETYGTRGAAILVGLWLAGRVALSYVTIGDALFPSYVAVLDIALVFIIFKGDVRLS